MAEGRRPAGISTAALVAPVGDEPTGGDFHLIQECDSTTVIVVGDVTGRGRDAAPFADRLCEVLGQAAKEANDPAELLEDLNRRIYADRGFDRFVTACALMVDCQTRGASWAFAGHLPPHWLDTGIPVDGAVPGLPLGVEERCGAVSAQRAPLHPTEGFLVFTDGLEDVTGPGGDRFGSARVTSTLADELHGAAPQAIVDGLKEAACSFGQGRLDDDMCIVALRVVE